jgi:hypothetical protein
VLFFLAIPVVSWEPSALAFRSTAFQVLAASHEEKSSSYRTSAESPIIEHGIDFALGTDRVCRRIEWHLSADEIAKARCDRERARLRAIYHDALGRKYLWAARFPWLPVKPDPPEPE